jgi:hypothetical protein
MWQELFGGLLESGNTPAWFRTVPGFERWLAALNAAKKGRYGLWRKLVGSVWAIWAIP